LLKAGLSNSLMACIASFSEIPGLRGPLGSFHIATARLAHKNTVKSDHLPFGTSDASEKDKKHDYEGYRIGDLLQNIPNAEDYKAIQFVASDGYVITVPIDNATKEGLIAIVDTSASNDSDGSANWDKLPQVYRGPYEYSVPGSDKDFTTQNE